MIVYTPIFHCAELKLAFKGKLTWKVADTLQSVLSLIQDLAFLSANRDDVNFILHCWWQVGLCCSSRKVVPLKDSAKDSTVPRVGCQEASLSWFSGRWAGLGARTMRETPRCSRSAAWKTERGAGHCSRRLSTSSAQWRSFKSLVTLAVHIALGPSTLIVSVSELAPGCQWIALQCGPRLLHIIPV